MTTYIRTLVSGNKARYRDKDLNVDLDLAYITDNVIVMGYPAAGLEGLYRNRREDAKKFLQHRHGNNFWVFNFCPIRENSYPASFFDGRVSRYPFPDHHAPPLAVLPLIAREMRLWLEGSQGRVAVLHCKAGKGRSGTMACSYLLTLEDTNPRAGVQNTAAVKARAEERANDVMDVMPADDDREDAKEAANAETLSVPSPTAPATNVLGEDQVHSPRTMSRISSATETTIAPSLTSPTPTDSTLTERPKTPSTAQPASLQSVLELHTSKRMQPSSENKKVKQGVSIPSQRRWLHYWSLLLANSGPRGFWGLSLGDKAPAKTGPSPKVRICGLTVRMREPRGVVAGITRAVNTIAEQTSMRNKNAPRTPKNAGAVWLSLARYDDKLVEGLESWERSSRGETLGARASGKGSMQGETIEKMFEDGKWDQDKMVRSFARLGAVVPDAVVKAEDAENGKHVVHKLTPLSDTKWEGIRTEIESEPAPKELAGVKSEAGSMEDVTATLRSESGVVVDAFREMRGKLYMGQVFCGWFWLIPAFHMPERTLGQAPLPPTKFLLKRKEVDFPLGVGEALIDIELEMEWCEDSREAPAKQSSGGSGGETTGLAANIGASLAGT